MKSCGSTSQKCHTRINKKNISWLPAFIIAILPKCPFCIMAYSGAMSLCSGRTLYPNAGTSSSYLIVGLSILVLASIAFNHKGRKTSIAIFLSLLGIISLISSQFIFINQVPYYIGVGLLFFGIWYNGSFSFFYRKYRSRVNFYSMKRFNKFKL